MGARYHRYHTPIEPTLLVSVKFLLARFSRDIIAPSMKRFLCGDFPRRGRLLGPAGRGKIEKSDPADYGTRTGRDDCGGRSGAANAQRKENDRMIPLQSTGIVSSPSELIRHAYFRHSPTSKLRSNLEIKAP